MMLVTPGGTEPDPRWRAIRAVVPATVCVAFTEPGDDSGPPFADEVATVAHAVPARQHEFLLGRRCARAALAQLGVIAAAIPVGPSRAPMWPRGAVGSISHCRGFVGAAVARATDMRGLGFDVEPAMPLGDELISAICTAEEIAWASEAPPPAAADWPKVLFCAKEAIHKCIAPQSGRSLEFTDVVVNVHTPSSPFIARLVAPRDPRLPDFAQIEGRLAITESFVFAAAFM